MRIAEALFSKQGFLQHPTCGQRYLSHIDANTLKTYGVNLKSLFTEQEEMIADMTRFVATIGELYRRLYRRLLDKLQVISLHVNSPIDQTDRFQTIA